jgi:glucose/mannose-6-phosphate isomerase
MMTELTIQRYDTANMRRLLENFPHQIEEAVKIGKAAKIPYKASAIADVTVSGLGGSAIGGDLLRSYLAEDLDIPFQVNRNYELPEYVGRKSFVIISSYSGGTEETIAAHRDARKRGAMVLCVTSGGETEQLARKFRQPVIKIPKGYPPRTALGFSFFPTLIAFMKMKLVSGKDKEIAETVRLLKQKARVFMALNEDNPALELAKKLYNRLPIIYSAADRFDAVNVRWRGQLSENAKILAFGNVIPEMNHNELVGWRVLQRHMNEMAVVFLRDKGEHPRIQTRMKITKGIVSEFAPRVVEAWSDGSSLLARMFSLIALGDWTSYYLAILNGIDPTPVRVIDYLKWELGKT